MFLFPCNRRLQHQFGYKRVDRCGIVCLSPEPDLAQSRGHAWEQVDRALELGCDQVCDVDYGCHLKVAFGVAYVVGYVRVAGQFLAIAEHGQELPLALFIAH